MGIETDSLTLSVTQSQSIDGLDFIDVHRELDGNDGILLNGVSEFMIMIIISTMIIIFIMTNTRLSCTRARPA